MVVKVSVVVPVYNVEKYISQCLDSLEKQTFHEYEVIVLNDGSTDSSGEIAKKYCDSNKNFHYYQHANRKLGPTRNRGINLAQGEYILFVDSDDTISEDMIEVLYLEAKRTDSDIVAGETILVYPNKDQVLLKSFKNINKIVNINNDYRNFFEEYYFTGIYTHMACDKMYRKSIIVENDIKFGDNNLMFSEDNFFQLQLLQYVSKISFIEKNIYYYFQRDNSIMKSYKPDLMTRGKFMLDQLDIKLEKTFLNNQVISLIAYDIVIMEAINLIEAKVNHREFIEQMMRNLSQDYINNQIAQITKLKSFNLIKNKIRRNVILIFSTLMKGNTKRLASELLYFIYKIK